MLHIGLWLDFVYKKCSLSNIGKFLYNRNVFTRDCLL